MPFPGLVPNRAVSSAFPSPFVSRNASTPPPGDWSATNTSPLGATAMSRTLAGPPVGVLASYTTRAQKPPGRFRPPLSGSHIGRTAEPGAAIPGDASARPFGPTLAWTQAATVAIRGTTVRTLRWTRMTPPSISVSRGWPGFAALLPELPAVAWGPGWWSGCPSRGYGKRRLTARALHRYGDHPAQVVERFAPTGEPRGTAAAFHGGFWRDAYDRHLMDDLCEDLAGSGWAAWNVEYRRLGGGGGWPATFEDVTAALDLVGAPVVTIGHSAGGHLALWAAGHPNVTRAVAQAGVVDLEAAIRLGL